MQVQNKQDSVGRRRIRGSENVPSLIEELSAENWAGSRVEVLRDDVWLYGWDVLRGLIKSGRMSSINIGRIPPARLSQDVRELLETDSASREAVVLETLAAAVPKLMTQLQEGRYDPTKGAALETYFITGCAMQYKTVVVKWANELPRRWYSLDDQVGELFETVYGDWEEEKVRQYDMRRVVGRLLRNMNSVQKQIAARVAVGDTHAEIAADLGLSSPRAVERQMRRIRDAGWHLVNSGSAGELFELGILASRTGVDDDGVLEWDVHSWRAS